MNSARLTIAVVFLYIVILVLGRHSQPGIAFWLVYLAVIAAAILWHLRYKRKWQQIRAKDWQRVSGRFDEGELVTMTSGLRRGRPAGPTTGYQVWLGYDYEADGEQVGLYTLPFFGEFPNKDAAEQCRMKVANREIMVRVSPRNPKRSCVLDEDVSSYLVSDKGSS